MTNPIIELICECGEVMTLIKSPPRLQEVNEFVLKCTNSHCELGTIDRDACFTLRVTIPPGPDEFDSLCNAAGIGVKEKE